jgi:hypothetical protein
MDGISEHSDGEFTELARLKAPTDGAWRENIMLLMKATEDLRTPDDSDDLLSAWTDMAVLFGASVAMALVDLAFGSEGGVPSLESVVLRREGEALEVWRLVVTTPGRLPEENLRRAVPGERQTIITNFVEIVNTLSRGRWGYRITDEESVIWAEPWRGSEAA